MDIYLIEGTSVQEDDFEELFVVANSSTNALKSADLFNKDWDVIEYNQLAEDAEVYKVDKDNIEWSTTVEQVLYALSINNNAEEYLKTLPYIFISHVSSDLDE